MKKKSIYIVEDNKDIGFILQYFLTEEGFDVELFENVATFHTRLLTKIPDLFLLDVMLPDGNGIEICHDLKNDLFTKHIPVIVMSANVRSKQMSEMATPDDYISKPFDLDDIENRIKKLLDKKAA